MSCVMPSSNMFEVLVDGSYCQECRYNNCQCVTDVVEDFIPFSDSALIVEEQQFLEFRHPVEILKDHLIADLGAIVLGYSQYCGVCEYVGDCHCVESDDEYLDEYCGRWLLKHW